MAKKKYRKKKAKQYFFKGASLALKRFEKNLPDVESGVKKDLDAVGKEGKKVLSAAELALLKGLK